MEGDSLKTQYKQLTESYSVTFHLLAHAFLILFYSFCVILIGMTSMEVGSMSYLIYFTPFLVVYIVIIISLLLGFRGIKTLDPHCREYSFVGLFLALVHQLMAITFWNPDYLISFAVLNLIAVIILVLLFNLAFNDKLRLIYIFIKRIGSNNQVSSPIQ